MAIKKAHLEISKRVWERHLVVPILAFLSYGPWVSVPGRRSPHLLLATLRFALFVTAFAGVATLPSNLLVFTTINISVRQQKMDKLV